MTLKRVAHKEKKMNDLLLKFAANEARYATRQNIITAIAKWGSEFFASNNASMEDLFAVWAADAAALKVQLSTLEEISDAINDAACDAKRFFGFFSEKLLG